MNGCRWGCGRGSFAAVELVGDELGTTLGDVAGVADGVKVGV